MKTKLTEEQIEEARRRRANGVTFSAIEADMGVSRDTIRRALSPDWAEKRREQVRIARRRREKLAYGHFTKTGRVSCTINVDRYRPSPGEIAELLKLVPPDTRDLTGVLCGDPLPGRSALDRRAYNTTA